MKDGKERTSLLRRFRTWLGSIPHLFQKLIVTVCILGVIFFGIYAFRIVSRTGHSAATELTAILAVLTAELDFCRRCARDRKNKEE